MPSLMWKEKSSSDRGGGGGIGKIVGIVPDIMTMAGFITVVFRNGTGGYPPTGMKTTGTIRGMDDTGIIIQFLTTTWIGIGEGGIGRKKGGNIQVNMSTGPVDTVVVMTGAKIDQNRERRV